MSKFVNWSRDSFFSWVREKVGDVLFSVKEAAGLWAISVNVYLVRVIIATALQEVLWMRARGCELQKAVITTWQLSQNDLPERKGIPVPDSRLRKNLFVPTALRWVAILTIQRKRVKVRKQGLKRITAFIYKFLKCWQSDACSFQSRHVRANSKTGNCIHVHFLTLDECTSTITYSNLSPSEEIEISSVRWSSCGGVWGAI